MTCFCRPVTVDAAFAAHRARAGRPGDGSLAVIDVLVQSAGHPGAGLRRLDRTTSAWAMGTARWPRRSAPGRRTVGGRAGHAAIDGRATTRSRRSPRPGPVSQPRTKVVPDALDPHRLAEPAAVAGHGPGLRPGLRRRAPWSRTTTSGPAWLFDADRLDRGQPASRASTCSPTTSGTRPRTWRYSALVKQINPNSITIHGGPNTPKFAPDVRALLRREPPRRHRRARRGRGTFVELLAALAATSATARPTCEPLRDVPGLTFRHGDQIVTTDKRDRVRRPRRPAVAHPDGPLRRLQSGPGPGPRRLKAWPSRPTVAAPTAAPSATGVRPRCHGSASSTSTASSPSSSGAPTTRSRPSASPTPTSASSSATSRSPSKIAELKATYGYPQFVRQQLRQEHGQAPVQDHRDLHRGRHRGRGQDVHADASTPAPSTPSAARTSRSRSTTSLSVEFRRNRLPAVGRPHDGAARLDARRRSATTCRPASTATSGSSSTRPCCCPTAR